MTYVADRAVREYQMCARCVMDTTDIDINFDANGVCNHCRVAEHYIKHYSPVDRREVLLRQMIAEVKKYGEGKPYDSIIGLSGGVDSSYLAVKIGEWGLRPLAVHVDAGWNSELAVKNIDQIVTKVGLDLHTHVVDWEEMRDLQLAFLRSNLANQDVPQDHAFFAALYNYAVKNKIKYVISGSNYATESILATSWGYNAMDIRHVRGVHARFGRCKLKTFPLVGFFKYHIYYPDVRKMTVLEPLNLIDYRKEDAIDYLEKNYGWRYYGGKHYESRWTRFFQAYYLPTKYGYDKRKAHLASLIIAGEITRETALLELEKPLYTENELSEDKAFVAKKLGISVAELDDLVAAPPRHYTEFPNHEALARRLSAGRAVLGAGMEKLRRAFA
jgi:N-acetyl sugar amidotransferase